MRKKLSQDVLEYFREQGKRGGRTASKRMTAEQKSERARKAGLARQAKARAAKPE